MARDKLLPMSQKEKNRKKQQKPKPLAAGRILIVCEGTKTEPNYFKWWAKQLENIKNQAKTRAACGITVDDEIRVEGDGKNTKTLVEQAIKIRNKAFIDYTECWCAFDRDSFPPDHYNDAITNAENAGFHVAYTNEAFELWYLLHFDYIWTGVSRKQYEGMLTGRLGKKYKKNDPNMYETLNKHPDADQQRAIKNAERLLNTYHDAKYANHNPSTTVHKLVERLNTHVGQFRCQVASSYPLSYQYTCEECKNQIASDSCLKLKPNEKNNQRNRIKTR